MAKILNAPCIVVEILPCTDVNQSARNSDFCPDGTWIWDKFSTNWEVHLTESIFKHALGRRDTES